MQLRKEKVLPCKCNFFFKVKFFLKGAQKQSTRKGSSYGGSHTDSLKSLDLSVKRRKTETTLHG